MAIIEFNCSLDNYINKYNGSLYSICITDESKLKNFGNDRRAKVCRETNAALEAKNLVTTMNHNGGSVMVQGAVMVSGVRSLAFNIVIWI